MGSSFKVNGLDGLTKKLRANATLDDVKTVVKINTNELTESMQRETQNVLTGHWEGNKFIKPTGYTKRSIVSSFSSGGLTGHTGPKSEHAPYLIKGTRFMAKRDFFFPPLRTQKEQFKTDIKRLVE